MSESNCRRYITKRFHISGKMLHQIYISQMASLNVNIFNKLWNKVTPRVTEWYHQFLESRSNKRASVHHAFTLVCFSNLDLGCANHWESMWERPLSVDATGYVFWPAFEIVLSKSTFNFKTPYTVGFLCLDIYRRDLMWLFYSVMWASE